MNTDPTSPPTAETWTTFGQCGTCRRVRKYRNVVIVDASGAGPGLGRILYSERGLLMTCCGGAIVPQDYFNADDEETRPAIGKSVPLSVPPKA